MGCRTSDSVGSDLCKSFPRGTVVKNPPAYAGDMSSIPGLRRFSGGANGNPLQYRGLENSMDQRRWAATQSMRSQRPDTTECLSTRAMYVKDTHVRKEEGKL